MYEIIEPIPATKADILRGHKRQHLLYELGASAGFDQGVEDYADAYADSIPLLIFAGQVARTKMGTDEFQHINVGSS